MADIVITPADVISPAGAASNKGTAGAAIVAGQLLYKDSTAADALKPADANLSAAAATVVGIALNGAAIGQPVSYQSSGNITLSSVVTVGTIYVASATAGGIAPSTDLVAGWFTSIIGIGVSATQIKLQIQNSGVAVP